MPRSLAATGGILLGPEYHFDLTRPGIGLYGGTMLEGSIGTLASAHAFATLERLDWHSELFGPLLLTEDILVEPPTYRDFQLLLPQGPGLGVSLDEDRLAHFRRDRSSLAVTTA